MNTVLSLIVHNINIKPIHGWVDNKLCCFHFLICVPFPFIKIFILASSIHPHTRVAKIGFYGFCRTQFHRLSAKFLSLNMQIRNNFKNTILTANKTCKLCNYYVNSLVISCSTCWKGEKDCTVVNYVTCAFLPQFQFCCNLRNFSAKS